MRVVFNRSAKPGNNMQPASNMLLITQNARYSGTNFSPVGLNIKRIIPIMSNSCVSNCITLNIRPCNEASAKSRPSAVRTRTSRPEKSRNLTRPPFVGSIWVKADEMSVLCIVRNSIKRVKFMPEAVKEYQKIPKTKKKATTVASAQGGNDNEPAGKPDAFRASQPQNLRNQLLLITSTSGRNNAM